MDTFECVLPGHSGLPVLVTLPGNSGHRHPFRTHAIYLERITLLKIKMDKEESAILTL